MNLQNFKQMKQKTQELRYCTFLFFQCRASVVSYLSENEAKNLQKGDIHPAQVPDFGMGHLGNHLGALRSVMAYFFAFFMLFHLHLTLPDLGGGGRANPTKGFSSITFDRDNILKRNFG